MNKTNIVAEPGKQVVVITRTFDAPRELVFKALTDPKLVPQWWGPRYLTTTIDKLDAKPGGSWRFVQRAPDGGEHAFHGVFHAVVPAERIVQTFEYEGVPGHVALDTAVLEEVGGQTRWTATTVFQSLADRDGMMQSGMESGATESYERLTELLAKMSADKK